MLPDYVTVEGLMDFMGVDTIPETNATLAADSAMQTVRRYMEQAITLVEDDLETHTGKGLVTIRLRQRPVRAVLSVTVGTVLLTADEFTLQGAVLRRVASTFPKGVAVEIVYDHGWDTELDSDSGDDYDPVPADIVLVTLSIASRRVRNMGEDETLRSETIGQYAYSRFDPSAVRRDADLLQAEAAVLDRYTVRLVP